MKKKADRPNVLFITADQLPASILGAYGNPRVKTPNIDRLADQGVLFENCYCNSPLCAPSRASMFSGQLVSRIGVYDNGCELPAAIPTFVHHLRSAGYKTILSGKGHFIGPDQLHGFEQRLTTDIYPASFIWSPDWNRGVGLNPGSNVEQVRESGKCIWSLQLDYDEETLYRALSCLRAQARRLKEEDDSPFFLNVSFTHPHDPFIITADWWDLYNNEEIDLPAISAAEEIWHPFNQWLQIHHGVDTFPLSEKMILDARHAFYGMCSYLDSLVGHLINELKTLGIHDNTLVIFSSDHGEMLGEHGMWFKRTFYDECAKVPLIVSWPSVLPGNKRNTSVVSLVDLLPTLCELCLADQLMEKQSLRDGDSFCELLTGNEENWKDEAVLEYCGEGVLEPMRMLRRGKHKYIYIQNQRSLLFDLKEDPQERLNLSGRPELRSAEDSLRDRIFDGWDPEIIKQAIIQSQQSRIILNNALSKGRQFSWDFDPSEDPAQQYVRSNSQIENLNARFPKSAP